MLLNSVTSPSENRDATESRAAKVTRIATSGAPRRVDPEIAYSCVMSSTGGVFSDSDHTEVIAALEDTVLGGGLRRLFRQVDGIAITPADDASNSASVPQAFIGGSDIVRRAFS